MVLLSDFLKSLEKSYDDLELVSFHEVFKRVNVYFFDDKDGSYNLLEYLGYTGLGSVSYIFRLRGSKSGFLFDYSLSELFVSSCLYCRPRRACRDWFENVLLPH
ncbi:MAG TPA: hypothetical protein H9992_01420 [Candidatus Prevotella intestinigallinarum]|nr:hypothetical protein [Candidatus Prevotella intestinigallinarum]